MDFGRILERKNSGVKSLNSDNDDAMFVKSKKKTEKTKNVSTSHRRPSTVAHTGSNDKERFPFLFPELSAHDHTVSHLKETTARRRPSTAIESSGLERNEETKGVRGLRLLFPTINQRNSSPSIPNRPIKSSRSSVKSLFGDINNSTINNSTGFVENQESPTNHHRRSSSKLRYNSSIESHSTHVPRKQEEERQGLRGSRRCRLESLTNHLVGSREVGITDDAGREDPPGELVDTLLPLQILPDDNLNNTTSNQHNKNNDEINTNQNDKANQHEVGHVSHVSRDDGASDILGEPPALISHQQPHLGRDVSTDAKKVAAAVCKDSYIYMMMEKELLKRRMRKREISAQEYKLACREAAIKFQENYDETLQVARKSIDEGILNDDQFEELKDLRNSDSASLSSSTSRLSGGGYFEPMPHLVNAANVDDKNSSDSLNNKKDVHSAVIVVLAYQREQDENRTNIKKLINKRSPRAQDFKSLNTTNNGEDVVDAMFSHAISAREKEKKGVLCQSQEQERRERSDMFDQRKKRDSDRMLHEASSLLSAAQARHVLQSHNSDSEEEEEINIKKVKENDSVYMKMNRLSSLIRENSELSLSSSILDEFCNEEKPNKELGIETTAINLDAKHDEVKNINDVEEVLGEELSNLALSYENVRALRRRSFLRLHRSRRQAQKMSYRNSHTSVAEI